MENKKRGQAEDTRTVDISDDYAVEYYVEELKTSKIKLLAAVTQVGNTLHAVKKYLKKS